LGLKVFDEKSMCLQSQYESFVLENYNTTIDGAKASLRNNADFLTAYLSYKAYQSWRNSTSKEPEKLPGLDFTSEQFFWIVSAQKFCSVDRSRVVTIRKILSSHPIESFRVINTLRNNEDFARDFSCPLGSAMNIAVKC
jgi:predicted metalloendopeptidase